MSEIPGWQTKRLDEIGQVFSGSTPSTTVKRFWDGDIIWVTPYDLARIKTPYLDDSNKRITEAGLESCSANLLPPGSLVISSRAPIGYLALPTVEFCTNQGCKSIKLKPQFDSEFTYYNMLFNVEKIKGLGEGTTFAEISKAALSTVEFGFPESKPEQAKIAEVLSTVDRAIEQTEALIAKQQRIKAGLLQDLLTRGIDEHGNLRSEATHAFKDSPLGRIPVEWEVKALESLSTTVTSGSRDWARYYSVSGALFVRIGNLTREHINFRFNSIIHVEPPKNADGQRTRLEPGDILISITADLGIVAVVNNFIGEAYINQHIALVRPSEGVNPRFIGHFLASSIAQQFISELNDGGAKAGLNLPTVRGILAIVPGRTEQDSIAKLLDEADLQVEKTTEAGNKLRSLKTALMQDLLTGKKRVTPLLATEAAT
ncbi:MAG: restriction endonuclease subunit S [Fibrobacteria bacterium]|nr:restriction endonuclease subunit S [Fibrobacteria bacterium]